MSEHVARAPLDRFHGHGGQCALGLTTDERVARAAAGLRLRKTVRQVIATVSPRGEHRFIGGETELAHESEAAAVFARAARVLHHAVAQHFERQLGLDQLDRLVGKVGRRVGYALDAILGGAGAPGADHHFGEHEGAALVIAADREERRAALARRDHALRYDLRERAHDGVEYPIAHHAARRARRRQHRVEDRALRRLEAHRPHIALAVRDVGASDAADRAVGR